MAITRYAGDRFTIGSSPDTEPTGVLDGAFLINTGNLSQKVLRNGTWTTLAGGGGGSPGGSNTQVQFNDNGAFGGTTGLTFDGQRLYANNFQLSGILYDSNASVGEGGMVLANEGQTGVHWKSIESVLSGVGGSGVANYVARWSDEDTLTSGIIYDNAQKVGISTASPQAELHVYAGTAAGDSLLVESTATNAADAPDLVLYRNSPSPANSDDLGIIRFRGKNDGTDTGYGENKVIYADIEAEITSVVSGSEGGTLKLYTQNNGSLASRITITGDKVGIGMAPAFAGLELKTPPVGDSFYIKDRVSDDDIIRMSYGGTTDEGLIDLLKDDAVKIRFRANAASYFNGGSVGIGTTAPAAKLEVYSTTANSNGIAYIRQAVATNNPTLVVAQTVSGGNSNVNQGLVVKAVGTSDGTGNTLHVYQRDNSTTGLVVKGSGKVGIGATNPGATLANGFVGTAGVLEIRPNASGADAGLFLRRFDGDAVYGLDLWTDTNAATSYIDQRGNLDAANLYIRTRTHGTPKNNIIAYGTGNVTFEAGDVGIGTTAPSNQLTIESGTTGESISDGLRLQNSHGVNNDISPIYFGVHGGTRRAKCGIGWKRTGSYGIGKLLFALDNNGDDADVSFANDTKVTFQGDGNVGIGYSSPTAPVHISRPTQTAGTQVDILNLYTNALNAVNGEAWINIGSSSATNLPGRPYVRIGANKRDSGADQATAMTFWTRENAVDEITERMRIDPAGNVGIGTTSPSTLLHIDDDTSAAGLTIKGAGPGYVNAAIVLKATNSTSYRGLGVFMHDAGGDTEWYAGTPYAAADQYMIARKASQASPDYGTAVTGNALFTVKNDGKVGIGTTIPDAELQVMNNDSSSYRFGYGGTSDVYFDADDVYFRSDNGGANQITKKGGSLGIGVVNAEHKLHVAGDAIISGYLYDSTNSTGVDGYVLTSREDGPQWDYIEDILSGVGGNGTANYVPKWEDSDTIGNSIIYDNGSNIGIGNAVPSGTLDIVGSNGTVDVAADGDAQELIIRNNDRAGIQILSSESSNKMGSILFGSASDANGANISYFPYDKLLRLGTQVADGQVALRAANGVEAVRIDENGNVGIGANDPSVGLQVGNSVLNETKLVVFNSEGGVPAGLQVKARTNRAKIHVADNDSNAYVIAEGSRAFFGATASGASTNIAVQSDGNVGIGTTSPTSLLHLQSASSPALQVIDTTNNVTAKIYSQNLNAHVGTTSNHDFSIDSNNTSRIYVEAAGNVGIGTTDPAYLFDVSDDSSNIAIFRSSVTNYARVIIRAGAAGDAQLSFQNNTSTKWTIGNDGGDSDKFKMRNWRRSFRCVPIGLYP